MAQPTIEQLALLSDRNTNAIIDTAGTISWYCPERFDSEAVCSSLVDENTGGHWRIALSNSRFLSRNYIQQSSVLESHYDHFTVTDFMPIGCEQTGILRMFSPSKSRLESILSLRGNYGKAASAAELIDEHFVRYPSLKLFLYSSFAIRLVQEQVVIAIPPGESGWIFLANQAMTLQTFDPNLALKTTLDKWSDLQSNFSYEGAYRVLVNHSIRAIQQLSCGKTGGVLAAGTTSLPEVIGGERNYDYRYVWVRDAALITGALSVLESSGKAETAFLGFMAAAMDHNHQEHVCPVYTIDQHQISELETLPLTGYRHSTPVHIGNTASKQRQLDADASVLIAFYTIYQKYDERIHWETAQRIANHICNHWQKPDNGIWEEGVELQYTAGKVFAARGLEMMSIYAQDPAEQERWRQTAKQIRDYVSTHCLTSYGAFANYAGSEEVDVSAALYVLWSYCPADDPHMLRTIERLETKHLSNQLFRRTLVEFDAQKEGVFLAGCCWMAHYYAVAGAFEKSKALLDAVASCANDLGFFSEEYDEKLRLMLGNFDQTFVHSSFICAANGLSREMEGIDTVVR